MKSILVHSATNINFSRVFSTQDFERELTYLQDQIDIQQNELLDLEEAHRARPYRNEYVATMRHGYQSSLRELHNQISNVRSMLDQSGTASVQI